MKRLLPLALVISACVVDTTTRTFDPQTGHVLNEQSVRIKVDAVAVTTPGTAVKIGDGYARDTGRPFDLLDTNGDGTPDLARDNNTGKYYKITGWELLQQRQSTPHAPSFVVDLYRNDPFAPLLESPRLDGPTLCDRAGFTKITQAGSGDYTLKNVLVYEFLPVSNLLDSFVSVGIRQSSDWAFADVEQHPSLRYEFLAAEPTASRGEHFMVLHVEGKLIDVARYLADNGTQKFFLRSIMGPEVVFVNRGDTVEFFVNDVSVGVAPL